MVVAAFKGNPGTFNPLKVSTAHNGPATAVFNKEPDSGNGKTACRVEKRKIKRSAERRACLHSGERMVGAPSVPCAKNAY